MVWRDTIPLLVSFAHFLTLRFSSKSCNVSCACVRNFCTFSSTDRIFALQFLHKCLGRPSSSVTESCSSSLACLGQSSFKLDDKKAQKSASSPPLPSKYGKGIGQGPQQPSFPVSSSILHKIICALYTRLRNALSVNPAHAHTVVPRSSFPPPC